MTRANLALVALLACLPAVDAWAFVPTMTCTATGQFKCGANETAKQVRWASRCVPYYINEVGSADVDGTGGSTESSIDASFAAWNDVLCSDLTFSSGGLTDEDRAEYVSARGDSGNANVVVWRDTDWPYASATAFAITSVTFNPESGLIVDADIELNGDDHDFTVGDTAVNIDVQNTLTHEVGHFLGLDHSATTASTMFASAAVGEVQKRTLDQDDIDGICAIYPVVDPNRVCSEPEPFIKPTGKIEDDGCCATAPSGRPESLPGAVILAILGLALFRIRKYSGQR